MADHLNRLAQSLGLQHLLLDPGSLEKRQAGYEELILAQRLLKTSLDMELRHLHLQPHQHSKKIKNKREAICRKLQMTETFFAMAAHSLGQQEDFLNMQGQFAEPTFPALPLPVPYPFEIHCVPHVSHPVLQQHHLSLAQYQFQPDLLQPTMMPPLYQPQENLMSSVMPTPEHSTQNLKSQFSPSVKPLGAIEQQPELTLTQSTTSHNVIQYSVSQTQYQSEQNLQLPPASLTASPKNLLKPLMLGQPQQNSQKPQINQPQYANLESVRQELTMDLTHTNLQQTPLITPNRAAPENFICSSISEPHRYNLQQSQINRTQFATLENLIAKLQSELPQQNFQQPEISQTQFATLENVIKLQSQQNCQLPEMSQIQFATLENLIAKLQSELPQQSFQQPEINQTQFAALENLIRKLQSETHQQNLREPEINQTLFATLENLTTNLQSQKNFQPEIFPTQIATLENLITKLQSEPDQQILQQSEINETQFATLENLITKLQSQQNFQQPEISQTQLAVTLENLIQTLQSEPPQQNFQESEISQARFSTLENVIKNLNSAQPETQYATLENMTDTPDQNIVNKIRSAIVEKLRNEISNDSPHQNMELNQISSTESAILKSLIQKLTFGTSQSNLEIRASTSTQHRSHEQCLLDFTLPLHQQKGSVRESKFGDVWRSLGSDRVYRQEASSSSMSATNAGGPDPFKKHRQRGKRKRYKTDDEDSSYDAYGSWQVLNECDVQSENQRLILNNDRQTQNYDQASEYGRQVQDREWNTHNYEKHVQSYKQRAKKKKRHFQKKVRQVQDREQKTRNYEQQVQSYERQVQNNEQQVQNYEQKTQINKQFHIAGQRQVQNNDWWVRYHWQAQNYK